MSRAKKRFDWFLSLLALIALAALGANAALAGIAFTGDYSPAPPWTSATTGYIGTTGSATMTTGVGNVTVDAGDDLASASAYLGYLSGSTGTAIVTGSGSTWTSGGEIRIAGSGKATLDVLAGGVLTSATAIIAEAAGSNGTATVDGAGSAWTTSGNFFVGDNGNGYLNITNGAAVNNGAGAYIGNNPTTAYGEVTVDGAGSSWDVGSQILLGGSFGGVGQIIITNGGAVSSGTGAVNIGTGTSSTALVTVDGASSTLSSGHDLYVGDGSAGTLTIAHGGYVSVAKTTEIGTRPTGIGELNFGTGGGTLSTVGLAIGANSTLSGTGLIQSKGISADGINLLFDGNDLANHGLNQTFNVGSVAINVDMSDSNNVGNLGVGVSFGGVGTLNIRNGIEVFCGESILGDQSMSSGTATIDGAGSKLTTLPPYGRVVVGNWGNGTLIITNGGAVESNGISFVGYYAPGTAKVDGAGSTWDCNAHMLVGSVSDGILNITNGGTVHSGSMTAVAYTNMSGGTVNVASGSTWTNGTARVGYGSYSTAAVNVTGGGTVTSNTGDLGYGYDSSTTITVDGAGSTWANSGVLNVGGASSSSGGGTITLNISNSGTVWSDTTIIDYVDSVAAINFNGGTLMTRSLYTLPTGLTGTGTVNTHGIVSDVDLTFDSTHPASQTLTLNGVTMNLDTSDSSYTGDLSAGYSDSSNHALTIADGLTVYSADGYVGYFGSGSTGTADVNAATWNLAGNLRIGGNGTGSLNIANGGNVVCAGATTVAYGKGTLNFGAGGGTLTTKGLYASSADMTGAGVIDANGLVSDVDLSFDNSATTTLTSGSVTVNLDMSDPGNVDALGVGWNTAATLTICNGAAVKSSAGYLGYASGGSGTVDGAGTSWDIAGNLLIRNLAGRLNVTGGAAVSDATATISAGCIATVDGADSIWTTSGLLTIAGNRIEGAAGNLTISNGGTAVCEEIEGGNRTSWSYVNGDGGTLKANADNDTWTSGNVRINILEGGLGLDTDGYNVGLAAPLLHKSGTPDGGITKLGAGTLLLTAANTYDGLTTVKAGVLELGASSQTVVLTGGGADIQGGKMVFDYTAAAPDLLTPLTASFTGGTAPWSTGQFLSATSDGSHGLGWADNGIDQVTVMYTLYGDSNLDGSVNGTDLNAVLSYYNQSSQVWVNGDFNYDGSVNGTDLNTVLSNYNQSLPASTAAVPEPSTLLLMVLGLVGLLAWRRRK